MVIGAERNPGAPDRVESLEVATSVAGGVIRSRRPSPFPLPRVVYLGKRARIDAAVFVDGSAVEVVESEYQQPAHDACRRCAHGASVEPGPRDIVAAREKREAEAAAAREEAVRLEREAVAVAAMAHELDPWERLSQDGDTPF